MAEVKVKESKVKEGLKKVGRWIRDNRGTICYVLGFALGSTTIYLYHANCVRKVDFGASVLISNGYMTFNNPETGEKISMNEAVLLAEAANKAGTLKLNL